MKAIIEEEFNLSESKKDLVELLKKIFRIEKISVLYVKGQECKISSTMENVDEVPQDSLRIDLTKLSDSLEVGKATDISKHASKYPNLQPLLKKHPCNFCLKVKGEEFDEAFTLVYVFHFEYQSLKILFEK